MSKLCPISSKVLTCNSSCAWFCEDVAACAIWKIAEGFSIMTAFVNEIIEKSVKVAQNLLEQQNIEALEIEDGKDNGKARGQQELQ